MLWGADAWHLLHTLALRADKCDVHMCTERELAIVREVVEAFVAILMCGKCRVDGSKRMPTMYDSLFQVTWELHNAVNEKLGRRQMSCAGAEERWRGVTDMVPVWRFLTRCMAHRDQRTDDAAVIYEAFVERLPVVLRVLARGKARACLSEFMTLVVQPPHGWDSKALVEHITLLATKHDMCEGVMQTTYRDTVLDTIRAMRDEDDCNGA